MSIFRDKLRKKEKAMIPKSPFDLFRNHLRKDKTSDDTPKHLWSHQDKLLESYMKNNNYNAPNVVIEMPTGSGKTLVGLLIAEYRRIAEEKRVVYLCPTKQLAKQVFRQAKKIGISASLLIGKQRDYDQLEFNRYQRAKQIAITTYSGVFNSNPRICNPEIILCDDAHAADQYISSNWSMKIDSNNHTDLFLELKELLKDFIPESLFMRMYSSPDLPIENLNIVELIPIQKWFDIKNDLLLIIKEGVQCTDLNYCFSTINDSLHACNIFVSQDSFLIKPFLIPTMEHEPFLMASQRIYMSATLGLGGDLERIFSIKKLSSIPIPEDWSESSIGRRFITFVDYSNENFQAVISLAKKFNRSLFLLKSFKELEVIKKTLSNDFTIFEPSDIEDGLEKFASTDKSVLLLAGRYDGIDLKGDICRFLYLSSISTFNDLEERFFSSKLRGNAHIRDRIRTRITQALGRCTRDQNDYSMVCINDKDILSWLNTEEILKGIHPELQAEIRIGLDLSENLNEKDLLEMANSFQEGNEDWEVVEDHILEKFKNLKKKSDHLSENLKKSAAYEVDFTYALWTKDYERAYTSAQKVLSSLEGHDVDFRPYRAFWCYMGSVCKINF